MEEAQKMTSRRYFPVKNNKNFSWHDDGTVKDRRRPNEKHYRFFLKILFTQRHNVIYVSGSQLENLNE